MKKDKRDEHERKSFMDPVGIGMHLERKNKAWVQTLIFGYYQNSLVMIIRVYIILSAPVNNNVTPCTPLKIHMHPRLDHDRLKHFQSGEFLGLP